MRLRILAIGRSRDVLIADLVERYRSRCPWRIELVELELRGKVEPARRRDAEAELLLSTLNGGELAIVLDEHGEALGSAAFATRLAGWRDTDRRQVAFLIGGADGHGQAALRRADLRLSLGTMTWPHEFVRVLLVEQLYRASAILAGHPYHRV